MRGFFENIGKPAGMAVDRLATERPFLRRLQTGELLPAMRCPVSFGRGKPEKRE